MKTAKCQCKSNKCEVTIENGVYAIIFCPLGFKDKNGNNRASWTVEYKPVVLSIADRIKLMASAWILEQAAFASVYDGQDELGGAVGDLESTIKTECTTNDVVIDIVGIETALESIKTRFPDWESSGYCHAFVNVVKGEIETMYKITGSPGSSLEDLAEHFNV